MVTNLHGDNPQMARVVAPQQLLFANSPRSVCEALGLNWWAALKLYEDGWLSFNPEQTERMDEAQEAELRFVGSLVLAGCDRQMLATLLGGLSKPYAYRSTRLYYDWVARTWRLLPDPSENHEAVFADWIDSLVETGDKGSLAGILELANDALSRVGSQNAQQKLLR
jgi:hypothetical protein